MGRGYMGVGCVVLIIAALAGCGSSSSPRAATATTVTTPAASVTTPAPTSTPTKAQFIAQADAVCQGLRTSLTSLQAQTRSLLKLGDTPKSFGMAATLFRRVQGLEQAELTHLEALKLPPGDVRMVTAYLQQGARSVALVGRIADALASDDRKALVAAAAEGKGLGATAKGLAQGYGFQVCGHGTTGSGLT